MNARGPAVLGALDSVAAEVDGTPAQVALAWVAAQPTVTGPLASARIAEQLEDLLGSLRLELGPDHMAMLDAASQPQREMEE